MYFAKFYTYFLQPVDQHSVYQLEDEWLNHSLESQEYFDHDLKIPT